jgi:hypothetical protein
VYEPELLEGPQGQGAGPSVGGSGGDGSTGGSSGGDGGTSGTVASTGGSDPTGGSSGSGKGGTAGSGGSTGGAGGTSASGGAGGSTVGGSAGTTSEGGEGGMTVEPCPGGDCCPGDDTKTMPGECGCGMPDTDTDGDLTADCLDQCPMDMARTSSDGCGCGATGDDADCTAIRTALIHRYSFSDTDTTVTDSVGTAHGTVMGTGAVQSGGILTLAGGVPPADDTNQQYVELPTDCLNGLTNATFEAWISWSLTCAPSGCTNSLIWQRVFDFSEPMTSTTGSGIFLTTRANNNGPVRSAMTTMGANSETSTGFRLDGMTIAAGDYHLALVVDDTGDQVRLYVDGAMVSSIAYDAALTSLVTTNCWLGRSNYTADAYFNGSFDEFRIYNAALSTSAIAQSFADGVDPSYL